jgi:hypothetical protein
MGEVLFADVVGAISFTYKKADGSDGGFVAATTDIPGTVRCTIQQSGEVTVIDHNVGLPKNECDREHSKWSYGQSVLPVQMTQGTLGATVRASAMCYGTASIIGQSIYQSQPIDGGYGNTAFAFIPLASEFPFDESQSVSLTVSSNGQSLGITGTIRLVNSCGSQTPILSFSGVATAGTLDVTAITDNENKCFGPIKPQYEDGTGQASGWQPVLSVHFPISNRFIEVEARIVGSAYAYNQINGMITAAVDASIQTRVFVKGG